MPDAHEESTSITLLKQIANPRDDKAWGRFYARYAPMIRGWLARQKVKQPDLDDLAQEVLLNVARAIRRFRYDRKKSFRGWLRTIVNNTLRDFFDHLEVRRRHGDLARGGTTYRELLAQAPGELANSIADHLVEDAGMVTEVLREAKRRATAQDWPIWQAARDGRPDRDIAHALGKKVGAVHQAKFRVNKIIREIVKEKMDG